MPAAILTKPCADVPNKPVQWLWKPFIARGKLALLDGEPGIGKSLLAVDLAARLSRGGPLPDGQPLDRPHNSLLLSTEGDPSDTVRPRVVAAGADLSRVIVAGTGGSEPLPQLPDCAQLLANAIYEHALDLVVVDPVSAFLPRILTTTDQRIRQALAPLAEVAAETGCAVLLLRHLSRSVGANAAYRAGGGAGMLGLARTAMLAARHPEEPDLRVLAVTKSHHGPPPASLGFRLVASDYGSSIRWCGAVDLSADETCVSQSPRLVQRPRERAAEFLRAALAKGPVAVTELEKLAGEKGLCWKTVLRAKEEVGLKSEHVVHGSQKSWQWFDPKQRHESGASQAPPTPVGPSTLPNTEPDITGFLRRRREARRGE